MSAHLRMRRDLATPLVPAPLPPGVRLLAFRKENVRSARELMRRVYPDGLGDDGISFAGFWQWLTSDAEFDPTLLFIAASKDDVVGFCHCWRSNFVKDLVVAPEWQGRGLGTALLTLALEAFALRGAPAVDLKTEPDNLRARSLCRRMGFVIVERIDD